MRTDSKAVLTKEELVEWFLNPITKKVRFKIEQEIEQSRKRLGDGWTLDMENIDRTPVLTAREVGKIEGLEFIFNVEGD